MAEGVGFEPTVSCPTVVFKTTPFGRSGIPPATRLPARHYRARWMAGFLAKARTVTGPDGRVWTAPRLRESSAAVDAVARVITQGTRPDDIDLAPR
jgi:hypothetical protein